MILLPYLPKQKLTQLESQARYKAEDIESKFANITITREREG